MGGTEGSKYAAEYSKKEKYFLKIRGYPPKSELKLSVTSLRAGSGTSRRIHGPFTSGVPRRLSFVCYFAL